jgi:hypothetical protein
MRISNLMPPGKVRSKVTFASGPDAASRHEDP